MYETGTCAYASKEQKRYIFSKKEKERKRSLGARATIELVGWGLHLHKQLFCIRLHRPQAPQISGEPLQPPCRVGHGLCHAQSGLGLPSTSGFAPRGPSPASVSPAAFMAVAGSWPCVCVRVGAADPSPRRPREGARHRLVPLTPQTSAPPETEPKRYTGTGNAPDALPASPSLPPAPPPRLGTVT